MIDGEIYEVEQSRLSLRGLHAGSHRAIVALRDRPGSGRELRFSLEPNGAFKRSLVLSAK